MFRNSEVYKENIFKCFDVAYLNVKDIVEKYLKTKLLKLKSPVPSYNYVIMIFIYIYVNQRVQKSFLCLERRIEGNNMKWYSSSKTKRSFLGQKEKKSVLVLESDSLDLSGPFYVGGVDYMDQSLLLPPQVWSASLKHGFVGCLKGELD